MIRQLIFLLSLCFISFEGSARSNLVVKDIRVGFENNKTRIVFELSKPVSLFVQEDNKQDKLVVFAPEDTFWKIPNSRKLSQGAFQKYVLNSFSTFAPQLWWTALPRVGYLL